MNHARNGGFRTRADVGRGAGDGAGCRQAAKHRRKYIGDALRNELNIRIVPVVDIAAIAHPIRDHGRHQRLDRAQHGDG